MICEFCRMRGHKKPAHYTVRVDNLDWELCYDDMWNEVYYEKRGKVVDSRKATRNMWAIINKVMKMEQSSNNSPGAGIKNAERV